MPPRPRLTDLIVGRLNPGTHWDRLLPAFGIRVGARTRTWICIIQGGKRTLGHYPTMKVAEARDAARKLMEAGPEEAVPGDEPVTLPSLFSDLAEQFLERGLSRVGRPLRPATVKAYRVCLRSYAKPLHRRPVEEIRRRDIAALLHSLAKQKGKAPATLARSVLSRFWAYLVEIDVVEANVVTGTPVLALEPRSRVLSDNEIAAIWQATSDDSDFSLIVRLCLWTGCRRSEAGGMRWSELQDGVWSIPGSRTKNYRPLVLPLPSPALAAIAAHHRIVGRDHLFGARSEAGFRSWQAEKGKLDDALGFATPWVLHDIRRSVETRLTGLGVSREIITRALNHGVPGLQRVYDHHDYRQEIGDALARWADELARIVSQPQPQLVRLSAS